MSLNNIPFGSKNNVRSAALPRSFTYPPSGSSTSFWSPTLPQLYCNPSGFGGYNSCFGYPVPAGITFFPAFATAVAPFVSGGSPGSGGNLTPCWLAELWDGSGGGAGIANPGANPTVLLMVNTSQLAGNYVAQFLATGGPGTGYGFEFPRSMAGGTKINAYISLSNTGSGLHQVGPTSGATIGYGADTSFPPTSSQ